MTLHHSLYRPFVTSVYSYQKYFVTSFQSNDDLGMINVSGRRSTGRPVGQVTHGHEVRDEEVFMDTTEGRLARLRQREAKLAAELERVPMHLAGQFWVKPNKGT